MSRAQVQPGAQAPTLALAGWERPDTFAPYPTFAEGLVALIRARQDSAEAFQLRERLEDCGATRAEIDAAWEAEVRTNRAIGPIRRRVVMTPADGAEIIRKLGLLAEPHEDVFDPTSAEDVAAAIAYPDDFGLSLEIAALHDDLVRLIAGAAQ